MSILPVNILILILHNNYVLEVWIVFFIFIFQEIVFVHFYLFYFFTFIFLLNMVNVFDIALDLNKIDIIVNKKYM